MGARFPARLHVLLARDGRSGVVLRRGPAKSVCAVGWDRIKDRFTIGQWLRGRIYERRADLSPDGQHLIYFAMNGRWRDPVGGSWTAISRAPYLKALVLLAKGDCWHGGGLFLDRGTYWLNDGYGHRLVRDGAKLRRDLTWAPPRHFGGECPGVYYVRLLRDGWILTAEHHANRNDACTVFEKSLRHGFVLRKIAHEQLGAAPGHGPYWDEHELIDPSGQRQPLPDWEWADLCGGTLVYAAAGCLYRVGMPGDAGLPVPRLLHDFNEMRFTAIRAPY